MSETVRIEHDFGRLPTSDWQRLVQGHPALRLEVLQSIAGTRGGTAPVGLFLLEDDTGIAAAATFQSVGPGAPSALDGLLYGRGARLATRLGASTAPALLVRSPTGTETALVLRQEPPDIQRQRLGRLLDGIEAHADAQSLGLAFLAVYADEQPLRAALMARGYLSTDIQPTARLTVEWADFDGYVRHLAQRSRSAAQSARRERRNNRRGGVSITHRPCSAADADALYALASEHFRLKNGTGLPFKAQFLSRLSELLGNDFVVFEAVREHRRVGMMGLLRHGSVGWLAWYGMEREDRPNDFTYANMNFYELADVAPAMGLTSLHYGNLALEAKRRRGCAVLDGKLFYRPRRALLRALARPYFRIHRGWFRRKLG